MSLIRRLFGKVELKTVEETRSIGEPTEKAPEIECKPVGTANILLKRTGDSRYGNEFESVGVPAILGTNEKTPEGFFDQIQQSYQPNGYIYGAGCSNILPMVNAFSDRPKGLVMVDIDPAVVLYGRMFVNVLKRTPSLRDWEGSIYGNSQRFEEEVLDTVEDVRLKAQFEKHRLRMREYMGDELYWPLSSDLSGNTNYYDVLHQIAKEGNIAVIHADMFDSEVLRYVAELLGFKHSNNVVYISNVPDHLVRREMKAGWLSRGDEILDAVNAQVQRLNALNPQYPHRNVFIDTTQKSSSYQLRVQPTIPLYIKADLI